MMRISIQNICVYLISGVKYICSGYGSGYVYKVGCHKGMIRSCTKSCAFALISPYAQY